MTTFSNKNKIFSSDILKMSDEYTTRKSKRQYVTYY